MISGLFGKAKGTIAALLRLYIGRQYRIDVSKGKTLSVIKPLVSHMNGEDGFLTDPLWDDVEGGWKPASDLDFWSARFGRKFTLKKDQFVNFASTPRPVRIIYPVNDETRKPTGLHDGFYTDKGHLADGSLITKKTADLIMYDAMLAEGSSKFKAWAFYRGVSGIYSRIKYGRGWPKKDILIP